METSYTTQNKSASPARGSFERSVEGIWVRSRKITDSYTSTPMMQSALSHLDRDVILTAVVVIPAATVWIVFEQTLLAIIVAFSMYGAYEYGVPAIRSGSINLQPIYKFYAMAREMIRTRTIRA